jgi:hypothetical protein
MTGLVYKIKEHLQRSDIFLLLFLLFFTIDMVVMKPLALVAALLYIRKAMTKVDLRSVPKFYLAMPLLGLVHFLFFNADFSAGHIVAFSIGCAYWMMSFFTFAVISADIRRSGAQKVQAALVSFFWINFAVSIYHLAHVMAIAQNINPYGMQHLAYGNSTGDYIRGVFLAPCYVNTFVNCAFAFYFLYSKRYIPSFLAVVVVCLTTSNFATLVLVPLLVAVLIFLNVKKARLAVLLEFAFIVFFYVFVSSNNLSYVMASLLEKNADIDRASLNEGIASASEISLLTELSAVGDGKKNNGGGKALSMELTYDYLNSSPEHLLLGAGIGNYSSQLALRTSDLNPQKRSRLFSLLPGHIAPDFRRDHYRIFSIIYALPEGYHSIRHLCNSTFNQIFGEYGLLGFISFLLLYVWYFLKRVRKLSYTIFIGLLLAYFLLFDYMFEYLSIVVFFELFFLLDIKEHEEKKGLS